MSVKTEISDGVLLIMLDSPPVNALGHAVRVGITNALDLVERDSAILAVVLTGAGKIFCGGADIKEFGNPPIDPVLPDVLLRLEQSRVPVVAALNGIAMGGGLETALACRYRIAALTASMALPEVKLGLIPGAGGTQRLPRLIGVKRAAEMITTGKPVSAESALAFGLVDELVSTNLIKHAIAFARSKASDEVRPPLSEIQQPSDWDKQWLNAFERKTALKTRGQLSPLKALEAVRASGELSFKDGLAREREIFTECMKSDQRQALAHAFFAERAVSKVSELQGALPRVVEMVGVLGAGTMGAGIATAFAASGYRVKLFDISKDALSVGIDRIHKTFETSASKGRISSAGAAEAIACVAPIESLDALGDADLVIEAVVETMHVKKSVFCSLDKILKPGAVMATNTSYLDINEIASVTSRPSDVIGMHFFSPANIMRLIEIVKTSRASPDALATAMAVGKRLGKICVLAGVCDGFIGNRIFKKYRQQAEYLIEDGAMPQEVDRVMRGFGFAMGPFQVSDLAGIDIGWHNRRKEDATRDSRERYVVIADQLYDINRLGQKTGAGWYRYEPGDYTPHPDQVVEGLIMQASKEKGITRRTISDDEIRDRILFAMINEGAKVLEEGIARRSLEIDTVFIHGYGFPAYRGGPMFYGDIVGPARIFEAVEGFAAEDAYSWVPSGLLQYLATENGRFASYESQAYKGE